MDVQMQNRRVAPHYGLDHLPEDDMQLLSLEERECIQFFEETIHAIEEDEEPPESKPDSLRCLDFSRHSPYNPYDNLQAEHHLEGGRELDQNPDSYQDRPSPLGSSAPHSPVDHDIIDLVHTTTDARRPPDSIPVLPDFQFLVSPPVTHEEMKPKRDSPEDSPHQPPPGSIPTPVVIASKIAEHQGSNSNLSSLLNQRRSSLELNSTKHGPPTHAKPTRLPENITMMLGSRENLHQNIANEAVSIQERRAQMLSNLTGSAHPLDGGEPACVRNTPLRSVSFHDPTPDKSRMEALSKLGLAQRRTQSVLHSKDQVMENKRTLAIPDGHAMDSTDPVQPKSTAAPTLTTAEVTTSEFNSFGGKSIILNPSSSFRSDFHQTSVSKTEASEVHVNNFGGRSRIMSPSESNQGVRPQNSSDEHSKWKPFPSESSATKSFHYEPSMSKPSQSEATPPKSEDLPRWRTSHQETVSKPSQNEATPPKSEDPPRWRTSHPETVSKPTHSEAYMNKSSTPRPLRQPSAVNPAEIRWKSLPKPAFRTQGITVQFSGRGSTDEQRRDALRKLGLLRDNS